jgi:hypothetical protein
MNTDHERLKIALQIFKDDLIQHKDWQANEWTWKEVIHKFEMIQQFVDEMQ